MKAQLHSSSDRMPILNKTMTSDFQILFNWRLHWVSLGLQWPLKTFVDCSGRIFYRPDAVPVAQPTGVKSLKE